MDKSPNSVSKEEALAREIYIRLIQRQYALPKEGMNDEYLEDLASISVRAAATFDKIWDDYVLHDE